MHCSQYDGAIAGTDEWVLIEVADVGADDISVPAEDLPLLLALEVLCGDDKPVGVGLLDEECGGTSIDSSGLRGDDSPRYRSTGVAISELESVQATLDVGTAVAQYLKKRGRMALSREELARRLGKLGTNTQLALSLP